MKKTNWTRRNKLFAGVGGVAAVLLAVFLVFTFVGMSGGGKLFGVSVGGAPRSGRLASYTIDWKDMNGQKTLPDGDVIKFEQIGIHANSFDVTIELVLQEGMWWKGVGVNEARPLNMGRGDFDHEYREFVGGDWKAIGDGKRGSFGSRAADYVVPAGSRVVGLILSKAKFLGIHERVYEVDFAKSGGLEPRGIFRITWLKQ